MPLLLPVQQSFSHKQHLQESPCTAKPFSEQTHTCDLRQCASIAWKLTVCYSVHTC